MQDKVNVGVKLLLLPSLLYWIFFFLKKKSHSECLKHWLINHLSLTQTPISQQSSDNERIPVTWSLSTEKPWKSPPWVTNPNPSGPTMVMRTYIGTETCNISTFWSGIYNKRSNSNMAKYRFYWKTEWKPVQAVLLPSAGIDSIAPDCEDELKGNIQGATFYKWSKLSEKYCWDLSNYIIHTTLSRTIKALLYALAWRQKH